MRNSFIQTFIMEEGKQQCSRCKLWEPLSDFIGMNNQPMKCCSKCRKYATEYQNKKKSEDEGAFRARRAEMVRAWYDKNREIVLEKDRAYYAKNREIVLEKSMKNYNKNKNDDAFKAKIAEKSMKYRNNNKTNTEFALKRYKKKAKERDLEWNLDDEDAKEMMTSPCTYCGILPEDRVNGIDRVDNAVGYVPSNCVPCCTTCNLMKGCMDALTFTERCSHIAGVEKREDAWTDKNKKNVSYKRYQYTAFKRELEFAITEAEFKTLTSQACTYCSKQNSTTHQNGIDRVDSAVGYVPSNCVPCCGECNVMKHIMKPAEFRAACAAVALHAPIGIASTTVRQRSCIAPRKK